MWVQGEEGTPEILLSRAELSASVAGSDSSPLAMLGPDDNLLLVVITDLAGDLTLSEVAKRALGESVDGLPRNAMVGLMRAQDGLRVLVDPTTERAPVQAALEALPVSGKAGLLDTVLPAAELGDAILAKAAVRLAVLYITDSEVGNYREDFTNPTINSSDSGDISRRFRDGLIREKIAKLDEALAATETPVFILHVAYRTDSLNQAYQTGLMSLAATTGGAAYFCRSQTEIPDAMRQAFAAITSQYSVTVPLPASASKSVDVNLESPGRTLNWRTRFTLRGN